MEKMYPSRTWSWKASFSLSTIAEAAEAADRTVEATVEAPVDTILEKALNEVGIKPPLVRPNLGIAVAPSGFWSSFLIPKHNQT